MVPLLEHSIEFYDLFSDTLINKFDNKSGNLKWVLFSPHEDEFYACQEDGML